MAASFGGLICMSVAMVVALLLVGLSIYPAYVLHFNFPVRWVRLVLCCVGALGVTTLAVVIPLALGVRTLKHQE